PESYIITCAKAKSDLSKIDLRYFSLSTSVYNNNNNMIDVQMYVVWSTLLMASLKSKSNYTRQ
ncbi:MAG TPA: hypothetical protein VE643_02925, partial [Nitrososphaeraceae archaeon]|nr:hypothetical protein [Nitrososphaeraceae archaeon]